MFFLRPLPAYSESALRFSHTAPGLGNGRHIPSSQQAHSGIAVTALRFLVTPLSSVPASYKFSGQYGGTFSLHAGGACEQLGAAPVV